MIEINNVVSELEPNSIYKITYNGYYYLVYTKIYREQYWYTKSYNENGSERNWICDYYTTSFPKDKSKYEMITDEKMTTDFINDLKKVKIYEEIVTAYQII
jgi:hypothetical protein